MRPFAYIAYTGNGQRKTGTLVAESERAAYAALQARGLMATEIAARAHLPARRHRQPDAGDRAVFSRQMAVLLSAGLPVEAALDAVIESDGSRSLHGFATALKAAVLEGFPISQGIATLRSGFPPYYASALGAGEKSGDLAAVFGSLADHLEAQTGARAEIATALIYPGFVAVVSLAVCGILVTTVAPELDAMFEATGQPLPAITAAVLGLSDWLAAHWRAVTIALAAAFILALFAGSAPAIRDRAVRFALRIPLFGQLRRRAMAAQYLRTLALVLASRQTALDAATAAAGVLQVSTHRACADAAISALRQGEPIAKAVRRITLLPPVALQLLKVGEETARIAPMAARAAELLETQLRNDRKRIAALLDPILMMVVGAFVLTVVLAVLLPIFDLQAAIAG
ncbi:type II secretion system F family protein [Pseudoruegeria sp. HB172150]|uniref:type II secretion system F family protein n=1 Tax=Pseudoruegeria sp. HB172150 TaxID=2721164 RepID=UPI001552A068|nr:type II secretion system F family protein [Pseudoruegeria sp. HB172150]